MTLDNLEHALAPAEEGYTIIYVFEDSIAYTDFRNGDRSLVPAITLCSVLMAKEYLNSTYINAKVNSFSAVDKNMLTVLIDTER